MLGSGQVSDVTHEWKNKKSLPGARPTSKLCRDFLLPTPLLLAEADQMDMRVDASGGNDLPLLRDGICGRADNECWINAIHHIRIAGLAYPNNIASIGSDISFEQFHSSQ